MMNYHFGRGRARWVPYLLLLPGIFFYLLISLGPSLATTVYSFTDATGIRGAPINWVGLDNYKEFLFMGQASRDNYDALWRTLVFCFFVTTIQFVLGLIVALLVNQKLQGHQLLPHALLHARDPGRGDPGPDLVPLPLPAGRSRCEDSGDRSGCSSEFFGGQPSEAFAWVIVVQIWANLGTTMMIFISGLQTIPDELYEAARIDGASAWQVFRNVTWPLLTPVVNTNLLLNIIGSLAGLAVVPGPPRLQERHPGFGLPDLCPGFRPDVGERHQCLPAGLCRCRFDRPVLSGSGHRHDRPDHSAAQRREDTGMNTTTSIQVSLPRRWPRPGGSTGGASARIWSFCSLPSSTWDPCSCWSTLRSRHCRSS